MIQKINGKYYGECDICQKETKDFDDFYDCKDWINENWSFYFDKNTQEYQHLCDDCRNLK